MGELQEHMSSNLNTWDMGSSNLLRTHMVMAQLHHHLTMDMDDNHHKELYTSRNDEDVVEDVVEDVNENANEDVEDEKEVD